jgi:hypothetical protein
MVRSVIWADERDIKWKPKQRLRRNADGSWMAISSVLSRQGAHKRALTLLT